MNVQVFQRTVLIAVMLLMALPIYAVSGAGSKFVESKKVILDTSSAIDTLFRSFDRDDAPGCAVAVYRDGRTVFTGSYGLANLDYGIPLSEDSRFYMTTLSQQVTAAAAGRLMVRGKLDADARVSKYIDDWPDWATNVRVHHLMQHTSGLPDLYELMEIAGISINDVMALDEYVALIKRGAPLMFRPGSRHHFSNSNYTILAYLVEVISGDSFASFADRMVLRPLGMTSTHFHDDRYRNIPGRVISYRTAEKSKHTDTNEIPVNRTDSLPDEAPNQDVKPETAPEDTPDSSPTASGITKYRQIYPGNYQGVGHGGLYSTFGDWGRWEAFRLGITKGDHPENQRADSDRHRTEPRDDDELERVRQILMERSVVGEDTVSNGFAHQLDTWHGMKREQQSGSFFGYGADLRRYPEHGLATLVLCNRADVDPAGKNRAVSRYFLKDTIASFLQPYAGVYHNEELQVDYELVVEDGALKLIRRLDPKGIMTEEAFDKWSIGSWDIVFQRDEETGEVAGFVISSGRAHEVEFLRKSLIKQ